MKSLVLAGVLLLVGCRMSQESAPTESIDPYQITVSYGNAVQGSPGWRCSVRHFRSADEVREYRIGFLGERDSAMGGAPEEVVVLLVVARSEGDLDDPMARSSYLVSPTGTLMPVEGTDRSASDRLVPPDALSAEQVEAAKAFARRWIERVTNDPTRDVLEERFQGSPEGWPL